MKGKNKLQLITLKYFRIFNPIKTPNCEVIGCPIVSASNVTNVEKDSQLSEDDIIVESVDRYFVQSAVVMKFLEKLWAALVS